MAERLDHHAERLREIYTAFASNVETRHYGPDIEAGIACTQNHARNLRHVADVLRNPRQSLPTATPPSPHAAQP